MDTDETIYITDITPIEMTGVRDTGMQSLILLANSLGWNVHKKTNQPVVLTARSGYQKRLPTNTSVRMGVFQNALSSIMVFTERDVVPTIDLIERIIKTAKPSVDHQRRLRLAVGETPEMHRERIANIESEARAREPQPVTTRIEIPEELAAVFEEMSGTDDEDLGAAPAASGQPRGPYDGREHGPLVMRKPYLATRSASRSTTNRYESDTSFERVWEDGFRDYECRECGKVYSTPKGVGAHSQVHNLDHDDPAWKHGPIVERTLQHPTTYAALVTKIMDLVLPEVQARHAAEIKVLQDEIKSLTDKLAEVEGEFDAFIELATSRRKPK